MYQHNREYPTFELPTKYGTFTVTVTDPTPHPDKVREAERWGNTPEQSDLFTLTGENIRINGIEVNVRGYFRIHTRPGGETFIWPSGGSLTVTRTGTVGYDNGTPGQKDKIRKEVAALAYAAITPEQIREARVTNLTNQVDRLRAKAEGLRKEAADLDAEADRLEVEAGVTLAEGL